MLIIIPERSAVAPHEVCLGGEPERGVDDVARVRERLVHHVCLETTAIFNAIFDEKER